MSSINRDEGQRPELPSDLAEIEAGLRSFQVTAGRLDRERLMFELGCESAMRRSETDVAAFARTRVTDESTRTLASAATGSKGSRFWPVSTAALMLLSAGLVVAMMARPERIVVVERVVAVYEPSPRQAAAVSEPNGPAEQRDVVEASTSRGSHYFTQRQIAVMQSIESMPAKPRGQAEAGPSPGEQSPLTARELWKTWSEENQKTPPTQTSESDWLRWLNPETWL